jgi:hypothetical protein
VKEPERKTEAEVKPVVDPKLHHFVANMVREFLNPFYYKNIVDKDSFKIIMKKSVQKV